MQLWENMENMKNKIKVSVIMPVYNSGDYLHTAVDSILCQSLKQIELILVDDGSTDGSSEKCDEYAKRDSRIVVIHQKNGGICNARNAALKLAKGEYIGFSDHDDEYVPGLLETCYAIAVKKNADVVKFVKKEFILKGNKLIREKTDNFIDAVYTKNDIREKFFELFDRGAFTCVWDGIIKKSLLQENQIEFDTTFKKGSEDIDFMLRLAPYITKMATISKVFYLHYIRKGFSTSSKFNVMVIDAKKRLPVTLCESCKQLGFNVEERIKEYSFYLMKEFFNYVIALYANPSCNMPLPEKIKKIKSLVDLPFVPKQFKEQSVSFMFWKSKKIGFAYFLYKYKLYYPLYLMYHIRLKTT